MRRSLLLVCALLSGIATAGTYRWTDANGRIVISDTPPPGQAKKVTTLDGKARPDDGLPYATRRAAENFPVTLYTAQDCVAECRQARELLNARRIPFSEKVIGSEDHLNELKRLIGDAFVPVLKVGRQTVRGYESGAYHNLLDSAGYPKSAGSTAPGDATQ